MSALTDSPAYPVLRQHLAVLALSGRDPVDALTTTAATRELDTADDPAAVLDWRLDPTGTHSTTPGPLPFARGLPATSDGPLSEHLHARHQIVTDLADRITADTRTWTPATAPAWARPFLSSAPDLAADLAVWRAALRIDDHDPRPTGPRRHSGIERTHQKLLDTRIAEARGDTTAAADKWAATVAHIDPRIVDDPPWPALADSIDLASRAGCGIDHLLTTVTHRPLPDEMPAAALLARPEPETANLTASAVNEQHHRTTLEPDRRTTDTRNRDSIAEALEAIDIAGSDAEFVFADDPNAAPVDYSYSDDLGL